MSGPAAYGSDVVVDLLADLGIEHVALNPGASFRGLHDSLVNHAAAGPRLVACLHEEISVAVAHGYAKAAGRPMAAAVHDVVGLQHAAMAVYNAWCDRVPLLLLGATGPVDASRRRPWIDWIHTAQVQATQVRDYTKWDDQPASLAALPESLIRAVHVADTPPKGPVYVCLDVDVQEQPVEPGWRPPDVGGFARPGRAAPDQAAVDELARWIAGAADPVVVADYVGRDERAVELLVELCEVAGVAVADLERAYNKASLNFPTQHPLNVSGDDTVLAGADVVIGLESRDLFGALNRVTPGGGVEVRHCGAARIASIGMGSYVKAAWSADYQRLQPADLQLLCEPGPLLERLVPAVRAAFARDPAAADRAAQRRQRITDRTTALRAGWRAQVQQAGSRSPIARSFLASTLDEVTRDGHRVLANGSLDNWVHRLWSLERADSYLGDSGGAGLGYGPGASLGAALAHADSGRLVVDVQSDGDLLYTPSALWTAAHERLPLLVVVDNNRGYNNSVEHAERIAGARNRPRERRGIGTTITDPEVDFAGMARAFGVWAEGPVTDPDKLRPALERAVDIVREQRLPALVDVVTGLTPRAARATDRNRSPEMLIQLKMQQRHRSAPADTATTPVEFCPSCATPYSDAGSFIGRFWLGRTTNYHCWCSRCQFTCDITPGAVAVAAGSGQPVAADRTPAPLCPSCGRVLAETSSEVTEVVFEDRQTCLLLPLRSLRLRGRRHPVHRVVTHEAAD